MDVPQKYFDAVERAAQRGDSQGFRSALSELGAAAWAAQKTQQARESIERVFKEIQDERLGLSWEKIDT